jgi:hypothetical protein
MKVCSRCGQAKPADDFYAQPPSQPTKDGLTYWCRLCYAAALCNGCNVAIGAVGEDAVRLEALARYVREWHLSRELV